MITKKQFISFIVAVVVIVGFVVLGFRTSAPEPYVPPTSVDQVPNPSLEVDKVSLYEKNEYYTIDVVYPKVNSETISAYFKTYAEDQVKQFKDDTSWVNDTPSAAEGLLTLSISYKNVVSTTVQNYIFTVNMYTGGAHGMQVRKTFSFNKEGQLLTFSTIFKPGADGITILSRLAQKELLKRPNPQTDWITTGAGPNEENYQSFVITDAGVTILFDPYQVAPYSDGAIDITIPVSAFRSNANPDLFPIQ